MEVDGDADADAEEKMVWKSDGFGFVASVEKEMQPQASQAER